MYRWFGGFWLVVVISIPALGQTQYPIFTEDFESGLDGWTVLAYDPTGGVNNNTPLVFDSTGAGIYGANIGYPGSQAVGFSSNLAPWDGQQPQWIEIQWPGLLEPGVYDVVIVVDRYVYLDTDDPPDGPGDEDQYGAGDRIYVLTDSKYDNPVMNYDGDMGTDGARWSKWSNKEAGIWEIGAVRRGQDIETTTGNVELRLLFHEKYPHYNTVAWDNLTLTLRQPGGAVVFTYPAGTAGTLTTRTDADNGVITLQAGHGLQPNDMVDVSWAGPAGSGGIRRMKVSSVSGNDVTVWAAVGASDALPAQGTAVVVNKPEDFEDGLAGWTSKLYGPEPNDTPSLFSDTDPLLYDNVDNPGSQSAGFSSNMAVMDFTPAAWMQQQFPAAVPGGETYLVTFEYDCYVYRKMREDNDEPALFPASGEGLYGPQIPFSGQVLSQSAGYSSNLPETDGTSEWLQMQWPAQLNPGTYDITLEVDLYLYKDPSITDQYGYGSRLYVLTDQYYDNPGWNFDGPDPYSEVPPKGFRATTWLNSQNGTWARKVINKTGINTTTGNIELRLLSHDKNPKAQSTAWDNIVLTIRPAGGGDPVFVYTEDFESGLGSWKAMTYGEVDRGDAWGVGNRMYVLTDDQYNQPLWDFDHGDRGNGFSVDYWPGWLNDVLDWSFNGRWRHVVTQQTITTATGNIEVRLLQHDKHPGPQAVAWDNLSLTLTRVPPPCGDNRFDRDGDGDVDQADFAVLQACYTGDGDPAFLFDAPACFCLDTNNDLDVDQTDLLAFENCASGAGVAADLACDDSLPPPVVPE
ncbi:MAG: hypothetical protein ACUVXJ_05625 [Phycisphaerae bacterium]